jgi:hypothetical protein
MLTQNLGHPFRNGQTTVATATTAVPIMGVTYATGTITGDIGGRILNGSGTDFTAPGSIVGFRLLTAGGNTYTIVEVVSTTRIKVQEDIVTETDIATGGAGVAFRIYEMPKCAGIVLANVQPAASATNIMYFGKRGAAAAASGMPLFPGGLPVLLPIDLSKDDMWIDGAVNTTKVAWLLLK